MDWVAREIVQPGLNARGFKKRHNICRSQLAGDCDLLVDIAIA